MLPSQNGGDSIVYTFLTVNPAYNNILDTSICEGESYHGWTSSGQYIDSLVTSSGCDSISIVNLSVSACTDIGSEESGLFAVYPNPNRGSFKLIFDNNISETLRIEIINTLGETVYSEELTGKMKEHNIHLENITRGIYLISVRSAEMKTQKRILIL
jgi:hypothetical protein